MKQNKSKPNKQTRMAVNIQSDIELLQQTIRLEGNGLTSRPIKQLRRELRENCSRLGIENVKELSKLLSRERRRGKKVKYSSEERKRNSSFMRTIEWEVSRMVEELDRLNQEKCDLEREIEFYKQELSKNETTEESEYLDEYDFMMSPEILEMLLQPSS